MRQKLSNLCKQESGGNREFDLTLGDSALTLAERKQEQQQQQQQQCKNNNNNRLSTQESSAVKEVAMEVDGSACREEEEEAAVKQSGIVTQCCKLVNTTLRCAHQSTTIHYSQFATMTRRRSKKISKSSGSGSSSNGRKPRMGCCKEICKKLLQVHKMVQQ